MRAFSVCSIFLSCSCKGLCPTGARLGLHSQGTVATLCKASPVTLCDTFRHLWLVTMRILLDRRRNCADHFPRCTVVHDNTTFLTTNRFSFLHRQLVNAEDMRHLLLTFALAAKRRFAPELPRSTLRGSSTFSELFSCVFCARTPSKHTSTCFYFLLCDLFCENKLYLYLKEACENSTLSPCPDFAASVAQIHDALCAVPGKRRSVTFRVTVI